MGQKWKKHHVLPVSATGESTGWNWPPSWKRSREAKRQLITSYLNLFYPTLTKFSKSETMILGGDPRSQSVRLLTRWPTQVRQEGASATAPWPVELTRWHKMGGGHQATQEVKQGWQDGWRRVTQDGQGPTTVTPSHPGGQTRVMARGSPLTFTQFVDSSLKLSHKNPAMADGYPIGPFWAAEILLLMRGSVYVAHRSGPQKEKTKYWPLKYLCNFWQPDVWWYQLSHFQVALSIG